MGFRVWGLGRGLGRLSSVGFGTRSPTRREASSEEERPGDERGREPEAFRLLGGLIGFGLVRRLLGFKAFRRLGI